ncbi:unnamed protein product [Phaedon cochleariae]|uniref:Tantalus-like domain-containing protein n=1 Tax=Phaedon cochleariae TaxID=80249 RepID=A0A9N9SJ10_PHACE|nr:unnamed protein product [Phaedon cochleariae]
MPNTEEVLDVDMAQLEIKDGAKKRTSSSISENDERPDENASKSEIPLEGTVRRSGRKRIRPVEFDKRRVLSKPKKLLDDLNSKQIVNYYLDKTVKRTPPTLETIFEEPNPKTVMSTRKFRRLISFPSDVASKNRLKVKKRVMKAKLVSSSPRKKMSMETLLQKLSSIDEK